MKLLLFLSHSGVLSRRKAFEAIQNGDVRVNNAVVTEPSAIIDPANITVLYKRKKVQGRGIDYILLNKPKGFVTTKVGQKRQRTVMELLPKELSHVAPVGRLDKDTEGVLLLTNDGDLANALTHPRYAVDKVYIATVKGRLTEDEADRLRKGIIIERKKTAPAKVKILHAEDNKSGVKLIIHEGRKRQVRLMLDAVHHPVVSLKRVQQGPLTVKDLNGGTWRRLKKHEIQKLRALLNING